MTGDELRAARIANGLSRPKLAALTGLHPDSVKYWERKAHINPHGFAPGLVLDALGVVAVIKPLNQHSDAPDQGICVRNTHAREHGGLGDWCYREDERLMALALERQRNRLARCRVRCAAKTRNGTPCRLKSEPGKRRCKFHGGKSTDPKTPEGN